MFKAIGKFSVKWRWLILIVWIVAVPLAAKTLPTLTSVTKNDTSDFLPKTSASQDAAKLANPFQGNNTSATSQIVVVRESGVLTADDVAAINRVKQMVASESSTSFVRDQGVSKDGQADEILIGFNGAAFGPKAQDLVDQIRATFTKANAPSGLTFHLTGSLAQSIDAAQGNTTARDQTTGYTVILIIVLLLIVYRSILAPIITLIPAGLSLAIASSLIAEATKIGVQVSFITQLLLVVLMLGAGTDYGLFLVFRVREEMRKGLNPKEAVVKAVSRVGETITFSSMTVIAALLSLLIATFGFYKGLGPALAIGLAVMLLAALTFLPALLAVLGRAAFWPSKTKKMPIKLGVWGKLADKVIEKPVATLLVGLIILGALSAGLIGYRTGGFTNGAPPTNTDSAKGTAVINAHFPAANNNPQVILFQFKNSVWNDPVVLQTIQTKLAAASSFSAVTGPLNINGLTIAPDQLKALYTALGSPASLADVPPAGSLVSMPQYQIYRALAQFISPDGKTVQFYALLKAGASGSDTAIAAMPAVRADVTKVARAVGAVKNGVLSVDAFGYDISHIATTDLLHIVPVVLIIIAILLAILLRSAIAPWYLIATVGISYLATLGFAMIVFVHIKHDDGLNFILPFLLFIFSTALGEDYNILVMSRIREEAHSTKSLKEAVTKAVGVTGTTVTSAGLILAGTFTVLGIVGGQDQVQQIGFSVAFGILLDTFFVRTMLVPSIAVLLGRWNWWPSKLWHSTK